MIEQASSDDQHRCLAQHIPGFSGFETSGCTMVVYLTDLEQEQAARAVLQPFSEIKLPKCDDRVSLDFRRGQYAYVDISRWKKTAWDLLVHNKDTKVSDVLSMSGPIFPDNRIIVAVEKEDSILRVKQLFREHDIPLEAFNIISTEAERRAVASISLAPTIRRTETGEQVVVPAVRWGGEIAARLVMGKTTLRETLRSLPPFPGHGPTKPKYEDDPRLDVEIRQVLGRIKRIYNPAATQTSVGFDRKKKLIMVSYMVLPEQAERFAGELDAMADMHEAFRDSEYLVRRGKLTSCVMVETNARWDETGAARVNRAAYFFTCST